ncbi:MAG: M48 family metalloprotease [Porticoccaceae bacterium]
MHYPCGHGPFNRSTTIITRSPLQALAAQLLLFLVLLTGALAVSRSDANDFDLPVLGDATSGVISLQQEFELGRAWLRAFRSRVQTLDDPELQLYLEQLLYDLAGYSALDNPRLELVVINNSTMNAFAVPGGVVGAHTGLFRFAESEDELASVLAHELAHLSQRHFARGVQNQRASSMGTMAGLLAGIILAATVGGDAGMAAITATQAAALDSALRYSRQNEQEADRIGIETLYRSGRDPKAVSNMFERMLAATRFTGQRPPEFLLTHPLTESRIADARNRIGNYPARHYPASAQYTYMRARALIYIDGNAQKSINRFTSELDGESLSKRASRYGLALALALAGKHDQAWQTLAPMLDEEPRNLTLQLAALDLETSAGKYEDALGRIAGLERLHKNNYALQRNKAEIFLKQGDYNASQQVLEDLSRKRPEDPEVWFQLAEVSGLAGDIVAVHKARAEYFVLIGVFDKARQQLGYAQRLVKQNYRENAMLEQRLRDVAQLEEKTKNL